ncbi:hypothetical protein GCM10020221_11180 [Streptomyces thioluteus]|uniref:Uncharacterized protein n=1 Tax=Streptomyces thioluteus TaxID=66431 RepID=A0ABN3WJE9_STRTU
MRRVREDNARGHRQVVVWLPYVKRAPEEWEERTKGRGAGGRRGGEVTGARGEGRAGVAGAEKRGER